ncbi:MAG: hypothetical protein H7Y60_11805 [Rhodospirillaceae bacterium]|nr:hypothetical protein [Rhodospirillales bacterium]
MPELVIPGGTPAVAPTTPAPTTPTTEVPVTPAPTQAAPPAEAPQVKPWELDWKGADGAVSKVEVAEPYRNADGTPNVAALAKATADMRKQLSGLPQVPETYDLDKAIPTEFRDDFADVLDPKAPLHDGFMKGLKEHKISQDQLNFLLGYAGQREGLLKGEMTRMQEEANKAAMTEAVTALGSEDKVKGLMSWFASSLGMTEKESASIPPRVLPQLEILRQKLGGPTIPSGKGVPAGGGTTEAELKTMMKDERYWKTRDRAFIQQVTDGFNRLYPSNGG